MPLQGWYPPVLIWEPLSISQERTLFPLSWQTKEGMVSSVRGVGMGQGWGGVCWGMQPWGRHQTGREGRWQHGPLQDLPARVAIENGAGRCVWRTGEASGLCGEGFIYKTNRLRPDAGRKSRGKAIRPEQAIVMREELTIPSGNDITVLGVHTSRK